MDGNGSVRTFGNQHHTFGSEYGDVRNFGNQTLHYTTLLVYT
jgi:hypothetical protein